ncbi:hypothetical protein niasHT_020359 [Heterodera trifolii]|uniref:Uncharacterized protein n=1 Tax=Heterodera trifolii TaxID=157864 RepID=A0ABD2JX91_9BILA
MDIRRNSIPHKIILKEWMRRRGWLDRPLFRRDRVQPGNRRIGDFSDYFAYFPRPHAIVPQGQPLPQAQLLMQVPQLPPKFYNNELITLNNQFTQYFDRIKNQTDPKPDDGPEKGDGQENEDGELDGDKSSA